MKASDFIVSFFEAQGIEYIFGYQGGMITHVVDSISKSKKIKFIQTYHEQSAAIAAEGYARGSNKFGVAISTSGPGATNMITGIANAYFDSIPVVYITGQVNSYDYKYDLPLRQKGFQETDIVTMVKPITKYAVLVDTAEKLQEELLKAVQIATSGRKGPVLLDIPMNIQRAEISNPRMSLETQPQVTDQPVDYEKIITMIKKARRPLVLCGGGVIGSGAKKNLERFLELTTLPAVVSLMGKGCIDETTDKCIGMIGSYGNRSANIVFSQADLVIVLGSRIDARQTGNQTSEALKNIMFIHIDIDPHELTYSKIKNKYNVNQDLNVFLEQINKKLSSITVDAQWMSYIHRIKEQYSQNKDIERFVENKAPYHFLEKIEAYATPSTIYTVDIGQNQMWAAQSLKIARGQQFFTSGGMAPMGYALHAAIGAAFAAPDKEIFCIIGDGGFHIALQSLLLISQYNLNIKVFVLNNEALGMITQFQDLYFNSNMAGTTKNSGYQVPDIAEIAKGYHLQYLLLPDSRAADNPKINHVQIIEMRMHGKTTVVPKLEFDQPLFNMTPFLEKSEMINLKYE
jgi:acetolactate synthase-1/2/3 large subunit